MSESATEGTPRGLTPEFAEKLIAGIRRQYGTELRALGIEPQEHPSAIDPDLKNLAWNNYFTEAGKLFLWSKYPKEEAQREICTTWARSLKVLAKNPNNETVKQTQELFSLKKGFIPNTEQLIRLTSGLPLVATSIDPDDAYLDTQRKKAPTTSIPPLPQSDTHSETEINASLNSPAEIQELAESVNSEEAGWDTNLATALQRAQEKQKEGNSRAARRAAKQAKRQAQEKRIAQAREAWERKM